MDVTNELRRGMHALRRGLQRAAQDGGGRVNVAGRRNVVVAASTGGEGEVNSASGSQHLRIRQDETGTVEVAEERVETTP